MKHRPVMVSKLIQYLGPKKNQNFIDATVGLAGHAKIILPLTLPRGRIFGLDQDQRVISYLKKEKIKNLVVTFGNFKHLQVLVKKAKFSEVSGIYFDLGLGSWQIDNAKYGLSFQKEGILPKEIHEAVNFWPEDKLTEVLRYYGNVFRPNQIAKKIIYARKNQKISTTKELVEVIKIKNPHNLAKVFQALRIVARNELDNLQKALPQTIELLKQKGKIVVISYHSGEDRIVKEFFRQQMRQGKLKILTKKPVIAQIGEIRENPLARSDKLRAAEKS